MADVLVLRTCSHDMTAYQGFKWPTEGPVEAPDWIANDRCGNGLHGALWGEGAGSLFSWDPSAKWLVVSVPEETIVDLDGKVKFPRGVVVHCGDQHSATEYIKNNGGAGRVIIGATATAGYYGTATAGFQGTATAGERGTATAGYKGTATAGYKGTATAGHIGTATTGDSGTATAGEHGTATAGDYGKATAGFQGTATAGEHGTATAGDYGAATAGNYGKATAGNHGKATAGDYGTATAGRGGTATAGPGGTATAGDSGTATAGPGGTAMAGDYDGRLILSWWDGSRYRTSVAYIGEDGILPNTLYKLNDRGEFVRVEA